ncbi:hypothetical protein [Bradyrhizobium cenepequi]
MPTPSPKTDPNVKIPPAVARLAAQAEAAFHASVGTAPAEPAPEPAPPAAPEPAPEPAPAPPITPEGNTPQNWEHAYKSMKGRYESSQNNVRELSDRVQHLTNLVETMQAAPAPAATPPELAPASLLTPEETNEYGAEFLSVVGKKALEQLSPELQALKKDLEGMKAQLGNSAKTSAENARNAMNKALDEKLPMWRQVNVAPEFHAWLALPDLFSGAIRMSLLKTAYEQNDTPRVLAFFNGFLAQEAASDPASAEPAPVAPVADKIPLETFAAPGRAKTAAAPPAPTEKPTFTRAQVATFFTDVAAGKYRGRDEEKNRIDAQIVEAGREGRIR